MALRTPLSVTPHLYMGDSTGRPLDMGTVYFGEQDKDPEFYPINLFSDDALTLPLAQPVHTKGGYLYDKGDMVEPHAKELIYSVKVLDSYGRKVFYKGAMMRNSWNDDVIEQINEALVSTAEQSAQIATDVAKEIADKAVVSSGFVTIDSFELGATITQRNQALRHTATGKLYRWAGDLPKSVPVGSNPLTSGGFGANAWLEVSDTTLRQELTTSSNLSGGASLVKNAMIVTNSALAISLSNLSVGSIITLTQEGREGVFEVVAGNYTALIAEDKFNAIYIPLADNPTGSNKVAKRQFSGIVNILWTGVKSGDDATAQIQSLVNIANKSFDLGSPIRNFSLYVPNGAYYISEMIYSEDLYNFVLIGDGKGYSSRLSVSNSVSETAPLAAMFRAGGGFSSNIFVSKITLSGNNRAVSVLDMTNGGDRAFPSSNATYKDCTINGIRKNGFGIDGVTYITKIDNVDFVGSGAVYDKELGTWHGTGFRTATSTNGLWIQNCWFRRLSYGIESTGSSSMSMVTIRDNAFDNINKYAVKSTRAITKLVIDANYFELVGREGEFDSIPHIGGSTDVSAAMVFAENPGDPEGSYVASLSITNNTFISGMSDDVIAISGYVRVTAKDNKVRYRGGTGNTVKYKAFIRSFGYGAIPRLANSATLEVSGNNYLMNTFDDRLGMSVERIYRGRDTELDTGIVIQDKLNAVKAPPTSVVTNNHVSWLNTGNYIAYQDATNNEIITLQRVTDNSNSPALDLSNHLIAMKGNYLRVEMAAESSVVTSVVIKVLLGNGLDRTFESTLAANKRSRLGGCVYIPDEADTLKVAIYSYTSGGIINLESLRICPANQDLSSGSGGEHIYLNEKPTEGTYSKGDIIYNSNPVVGGYVGWICTASGTAGTWKGFGLIEA